MKLQLLFKDYLEILVPESNENLTLDILLKPFGISSILPQSTTILVGHFLDYLQEQYKDTDVIDVIDVAQSAVELGYDPAEFFLDQAPWLMVQMTQELIKPF